jgi:outer membrane protein OmpA-like peptidoglycan-associated protein
MNRALVLSLGLIALAAVSFVCVQTRAPAIERDLLERTGEALRENEMPWASARVDGRDLALEGQAPTEELSRRATELARRIRGVRAVDNRLTVSPPPLQIEAEGPEQEATPEEADGQEASCRRLAQLLSGRFILFTTSSSELSRDGREFLDAAAALAVDCPSAYVEVAGHSDSRGETEINLPLSQDRADAAVAYLAERGVPADRLAAIGYGESRPVADNETEEGQARNRRIELSVRGE